VTSPIYGLYSLKFVGLPCTQIIYVESFARTNSLSLSGKILKGFVDIFVVQWPEAAGPNSTASLRQRTGSEEERKSKVVHRGWLV
jgi:beta-1,4-N-acetylglucosaminyltransferase